MTIVVLAKVVPELDELRFDPERHVVLRGASPLFVNPLDQRAVAAALSLRRPEEPLQVLSMSPPEGEPALSELFAHGVDEVLNLSDSRLRGSDAWVTAKVLARALRTLAPDLILAGRASTDSSTGQMPAQLAELLSLPWIDAVLQVVSREEGRLTVVSETEEGWARFRAPAPAVLTVSERIGRPRKPSPEGLQAARARAPRRLGLDMLGIPGSEVGLVASPTSVVGLSEERPRRDPMVLAEGPLQDRVSAALERIGWKLAEGRIPSAGARPLSVEIGAEDREVVVFASPPQGGLAPEALPLLAQVRRMGGGLWPSVTGFGPLSSEDRADLARAGAGRACWEERVQGYLEPEAVLPLLARLLRERPRAVSLLFPSTSWARGLAGRTSGRFGLGLVGDATALRWNPEHGLHFVKPSFGGGILAEVTSRTRPSLATVRPGSFEAPPRGTPAASVPVEHWRTGLLPPRVERLAAASDRDPRFGDPLLARGVAVVGMGVGGPEGIDRVLALLRPLGFALGATRRVVDAGWAPSQVQVGLTGLSIAPDLYLGVGLSGKDNHMVGVQRARCAVGINDRPEEPLFRQVDVGLVARWEEALPPLLAGLSDLWDRSVR